MSSLEKIENAWRQFCNFDEDDGSISYLTSQSEWLKIAPDHELISQAGPNGPVYLILSGKLKSVRYSRNGHEIWLSEIKPGTLVGEISALTDQVRSSHIIATAASEVIKINNQVFTQTLKTSGQFGYSVSRMLANRLKHTSTLLEELMSLETGNRLHAELMRLARPSAEDTELYIVDTAPTVSELATRIHTTRETASRELSKLLQRGLVKREPTRMLIVVPASRNA